MTGAEILALITGLPAIIGAITALIWAFRGNQKATVAQGMAQHAVTGISAHIAQDHDKFPPQPPSMS